MCDNSVADQAWITLSNISLKKCVESNKYFFTDKKLYQII